MPVGDREDPIAGLLKAMSRGGTGPLERCVLHVRIGSLAWKVTLEKPGKMRIDDAQDGSALRIAKLYRGKHWSSAAAESGGQRRWQAMPSKEAREFEKVRLLLGSILAWDLLDAKKREVTSTATWFREASAPVVHRDFDEAGRMTALSIDGQRWKVKSWHEERGALLPELQGPDSQTLSFDLVSLDSRLADTYFAPTEREDESAATIKRSLDQEAQINYDKPILEHSEEYSYIEASVPATWEGRLRVLGELARKLDKAGQAGLGGLPAYRGDKVQIFFGPRQGQRLQAPEGFELKTRKAGKFLVIHHRGIAFEKARETLEPILLAHAKKSGFFRDGEVLIRPAELPRADPSKQPKDGAPVEMKVELRIR